MTRAPPPVQSAAACAPQAAGAAWADDDPEFTHVVARQGALADDLTRAVAYGESHPEVFGGVWWDGPRLQVGFTSPQAHQADVRALLEHRADVDVLQVRWTLRQLTQVRAAVERRIEQAPGMWQSISGGAQRVTLNLRADGTALAAELLETHGEMLELTVGGRLYPSDPAAPVEAPPGPVATAVRPDLELRAICHQSEVVSGRGHTGELHIRNTGGQTVQVVSEQPLVATLLSTDGRVAGSSIGFVAGTGLVLDLPPGDTASIRFLGGTAGGPEYATPPGTYDLVVVLPLYEPAPVGVQRSQLVSDPIPLTVVSAAERIEGGGALPTGSAAPGRSRSRFCG